MKCAGGLKMSIPNKTKQQIERMTIENIIIKALDSFQQHTDINKHQYWTCNLCDSPVGYYSHGECISHAKYMHLGKYRKYVDDKGNVRVTL